MDKEQLKDGTKKVLKGYVKEMGEAFKDGVEGWKEGTWDPQTPKEVITKNKALTSLFGFLWPKKRPKAKTGLKSVLEQGKRAGKRWLAVGATMAVVSGVGHGITAVRQANERNELKENAEYFVQNNNQTLAFSENSAAWDINSKIDIFKLNKQQLIQYCNFMSFASSSLSDLVNDNENFKGTLDPAKRFGLVYQNLLEQIERTEKDIVYSRGASEHVVKRQILQKVFDNMQKIEKQVNQGKTQAERLQIAENLYKTTSARAGRSGSLRFGRESKDTLQKEQNADFAQTSNVAKLKHTGR